MISIASLAIGMACAGLIFLWIEHELQYDNINTKKDRLYSVVDTWLFSGSYHTYERSAGPLAAAMKAEMPGVENACRYSADMDDAVFTIGERSMYASGVFADSSVFSILTLPFVEGDAKTAFRNPYSVVLTQQTAKKFFGNENNVVGKTVRIDHKNDFVVSGVIKDFPENTTLQFEWMAPFEIYLKDNDRLNHWESNSILTLVELKKGVNPEEINKPLHSYIANKINNNTVNTALFSMNDWHLRHSFADGKLTGGGRIQYVHIFTLIAWIILLLACINFMNLATAQSAKRAKEIGVKKVLGSSKSMLVLQFIGEAMLLSVLAICGATLIISGVLPAFDTLTHTRLSIDLFNPVHLATILTMTVICGLIAGSYPAFYLSSFKPVQVLKGLFSQSGNSAFIRKGLVVTQFTVSTALIICTVIIYRQIQHLKNRDIGYSKNQLLVIPAHGDIGKNFSFVKADLLNTGQVVNVALANYELLDAGQNNDDYTWKGKDQNSKVLISARGISPELLQTCGIAILQGRDFNPDGHTDSTNIIISETLAKMMNSKNVLAESIMEGTTKYRIIGVVRDFVYGDMYSNQSDPLIFYCRTDFGDDNLMYLRLKKESNLENTLAEISNVLKKDNPSFPFAYHFVDDEFNEQFSTEMIIGKLARIFAGLAIIISCLGLFGLTAFTTERRAKEIGIRKVLGAGVRSISVNLSKGFVQLVFISSIIGAPIAWLAMHFWLLNYPYRISISWWIFAIASASALLIALVTISFETIKAALANPVKSLRSE